MNKFYKAKEKKMSKIDGRKHRKMIFTTEWSIIKKKYGVNLLEQAEHKYQVPSI